MPLLILLFSILLSCEPPPPDKSFALAYAELRIAEQELGETEDGRAARFQILEKHNLSAEALEEKIEDIKKDVSEWAKFQKMVVDILDSINKKNKEQI